MIELKNLLKFKLGKNGLFFIVTEDFDSEEFEDMIYEGALLVLSGITPSDTDNNIMLSVIYKTKKDEARVEGLVEVAYEELAELILDGTLKAMKTKKYVEDEEIKNYKMGRKDEIENGSEDIEP